MTLPVIEQTDALGIRVIARTLAPLSVAVTVYLVAKAAMPDVRVSIEASGSVLTVTPKVCHLYVLSPPSVRHADYPPYPAPVVPLCSFVISAKASGTYPATLRIKDSAGNDLVMPTSLAVVIKGESP